MNKEIIVNSKYDVIVSPSVLTCDFDKLPIVLNDFKERNIPFVHLDVMDGIFVPRKTFDNKLVDSLIPLKGDLIFDTHLMVIDPINHVEKYFNSSDFITIHFEAEKSFETILKIKNSNKKAGIALKPSTKVSEIIDVLKYVDLVLVMSVEPGEGGQSFMETSLPKVKELVNNRKELGLDFLINIDGGINDKTIKLVKEAGVDIVVSGTYLVKDLNNIDNIRKIIK